MQAVRSVAPTPFLVGAASILGGAVLLWAYARVAWPWAVLGWIALTPWSWLWMRCQSLRGAIITSTLCSIVFVAFTFEWFARALAEYTGLSLPGARIALSLAGPLLEPQFVALATVLSLLRRRSDPSSFASALQEAALAATVYAACEHTVPTKLFGDTLGLGLLGALPWAQVADLGGVALLTFLLVFANVLIARGLTASRRQHARTLAAVLGTVVTLMAATWLYGSWRISRLDALTTGDAPATVRIGTVQGNISHYDQLRAEVGTFGAVRRILDRYFALTRSHVDQADFWVWPETVYPTTFGKPKSLDGALFDREIAAFVQTHGRPLIFGAYDRDDLGEYNAAFFLIPDARTGLRTEVYRKVYPFPWTEHVPPWADYAFVRRRLPWLGTWKPGREVKVVALPLSEGRTIRVAALICYDALVPALAYSATHGGADLLVTISNDSWFSTEEGKRLSLAAAAFRSIETRRPQVRVTPTGISAEVDPIGRYRILVFPDQAEVAVARLPLLPPRPTFAAKWGERWLLVACLLTILVGTPARLRARRLRQKSR